MVTVQIKTIKITQASYLFIHHIIKLKIKRFSLGESEYLCILLLFLLHTLYNFFSNLFNTIYNVSLQLNLST